MRRQIRAYVHDNDTFYRSKDADDLFTDYEFEKLCISSQLGIKSTKASDITEAIAKLQRQLGSRLE